MTTEMAVIETQAIRPPGNEALWQFIPAAELNADTSNWGAPNMARLEARLRAAGFADVTINGARTTAAPRSTGRWFMRAPIL